MTRNGHVRFGERGRETRLPQGRKVRSAPTLFSPILANAYLHELDEFIEELRIRREKGERKNRNPSYQKLSQEKAKLIAQGKTKTREFKALVQKMRTLPSIDVNDPNFIRIKYLRYADDWIIGLCGSHDLAEDIKQDVKTFLQEHLKLTLNEEKTHITNARTQEAFFLGTILKMGNNGAAKVTLSTNTSGKRFKRRSTGWETVMKAPMPKLLKRLSERGFCTKEGTPTSKSGWAFLDVDQIISLYNGVNRGIQNYYRFTDNWRQLRRIQYILRFSLAMTLARKFKITTSQVFKRFGKQPTYVMKGKEGKEDRTVSFYANQDWTKKREAFQSGKVSDIDRIQVAARMRTRSKPGRPCCICGDALEQIVMHHVRHIRKLSNKREATGFNRILRMLNRKQIPVCETCHRKIHRGEYDGIKLTDFTYVPR